MGKYQFRMGMIWGSHRGSVSFRCGSVQSRVAAGGRRFLFAGLSSEPFGAAQRSEATTHAIQRSSGPSCLAGDRPGRTAWLHVGHLTQKMDDLLGQAIGRSSEVDFNVPPSTWSPRLARAGSAGFETVRLAHGIDLVTHRKGGDDPRGPLLTHHVVPMTRVGRVPT